MEVHECLQRRRTPYPQIVAIGGRALGQQRQEGGHLGTVDVRDGTAPEAEGNDGTRGLVCSRYNKQWGRRHDRKKCAVYKIGKVPFFFYRPVCETRGMWDTSLVQANEDYRVPRILWSPQLHIHAASPHGWDPQLEAQQREKTTLVVPMTLKELLQIRNNRINILVTVSGIHSHS